MKWIKGKYDFGFNQLAKRALTCSNFLFNLTSINLSIVADIIAIAAIAQFTDMATTYLGPWGKVR